MRILFESPSWVLSSLLVVIPSILIFMGVVWFVRKKVSGEILRKNHDVAGFTFSIIGVLYSVILGFTVISAQDRYNEVLQTIHTEALTLADLYRDAALFPKESRDAIRSNLRAYVTYVIEEEWSAPIEKRIRIQTQEIMEKIWHSYYGIELLNQNMSIWYTQSISKLNDFINARLSRQFSSWEHLSDMMWSLLIVGGIITVCFMCFFGLENMRSQMLMVALLAGYLSFILYLVYSLDHVFEGSQGIKPTALEQVFSLFDRWDQS